VKYFVLLILVVLSSCFSDTDKKKSCTGCEKQTQPSKQTSWRPTYISYHGNLDKTKFAPHSCDTINQLQWKEFQALPKIEGNSYYEGMDGRYFCDRSFSNQFNSFILGTFEGGDCGSALILVNCIGDSVISEKVLFQDCLSENSSNTYSTIFQNDSVFTLVCIARTKAVDLTGEYIVDSLDQFVSKEIIVIDNNGMLQNKSSHIEKWREAGSVW